MKKKYSKQRLIQLEEEMKNESLWEFSHHTISFKGPTSIRFSDDLLHKLHAVAKARHKPINRLVNEWVKPFVEGEYELLRGLR